MKYISSFILASVVLTLIVSPVSAQSPTTVRDTLQERREEVKEKIEEKRETLKEKIEDRKEELREKIASKAAAFKLFSNGRIAIGNGTITAINGTTLTVTKDGKTYTVLTDSETNLKRRFWGASDLGEFSVADKINVVGVWQDDAQTTVKARFIRNISIQKRFGVFFGTVTAVTSNGFTFDASKRGTQAVTVDSTTAFTNRREEAIAQTDVAVGHRVRVRGLWDSVNSKITEVTKVKDFSLPIISSSSANAEVQTEIKVDVQ